MKTNRNETKWALENYRSAILNAVRTNAKHHRIAGNKILFNGFWRNGSKENVCAWTDTATWHDLKTGEGGGVKKFAEIAFGCSLQEFMERFSELHFPARPLVSQQFQSKKNEAQVILNEAWQGVASGGSNRARKWLDIERGISISSERADFFIADLQPLSHRLYPDAISSFVEKFENRPGLVSPIINFETGDVVNCIIRLVEEAGSNKARFLPNQPVIRTDKAPVGFGEPHLHKKATNIILCEGLTDTIAATALAQNREKTIVIGATSANALPFIGQWLSANSDAHINLIFHLDILPGSGLSSRAIGQSKAVEALKFFSKSPHRAVLFDWPSFLDELSVLAKQNAYLEVFDLADACRFAKTTGIPSEIFGTIFRRITEEKR